MGMNYKITEHVNVGASVNMTNNLNSLLNMNGLNMFSPYQQNIMPGW